MTLIDTNVLLDVVTNDPAWAAWSVEQLDAAALRGALVVNDVIFAELSVRFASIAQIDTFLARAGIKIHPIPRPALFEAGKAFQRYRQAGGIRTGVLPDFFIGAHAAIARPAPDPGPETPPSLLPFGRADRTRYLGWRRGERR